MTDEAFWDQAALVAFEYQLLVDRGTVMNTDITGYRRPEYRAAKMADAMLAERRKRFSSEGKNEARAEPRLSTTHAAHSVDPLFRGDVDLLRRSGERRK